METNETTTNGLLSQRRLWLIGVLAAIAMMVVLLFMSASPASASLCITQGEADVEVPLDPADFNDRGSSRDNPADKNAAWEAHKNSDTVDGPTCPE